MRRKANLAWFLLFAGLILFLNLAVGFKSRPFIWIETNEYVRFVVYPAIYAKELVYTASDLVNEYFNATSHYPKVKFLESEVDRLTAENTVLKHRLEVTALEAGLSVLRERLPYDFVVTRVIARNPQFWFQFLTIDGGKNDGFAVGMPVITKSGLVGKLSDVQQSESRVLLLNDPSFSVDVRGEKSGLLALAAGTGTSLLKLNYVPKFEEPAVGEVISTSGLDGYFPQGIPVGYVAESFKPFNEYFLDSFIVPVVDVLKIRDVMVIRGFGKGK